jgi:hypothetical protein
MHACTPYGVLQARRAPVLWCAVAALPGSGNPGEEWKGQVAAALPALEHGPANSAARHGTSLSISRTPPREATHGSGPG